MTDEETKKTHKKADKPEKAEAKKVVAKKPKKEEKEAEAPAVQIATVVEPVAEKAKESSGDIVDELDAMLALSQSEDEGDLPEDPRAAEIRERDGVFFEGRYYYGIGRRKTSIAKVHLFTRGKEKSMIVNGVDYKEYFKLPRLIADIEKPLVTMKAVGKFGAKALVSGGGIVSQAGAVRLGIARALVVFNEEFRKRLRRKGLLTRDSRMVERKKYGKRKARRAPQWSKR
jgi:small subunit ribosomal protein S9